MLKTCTFTVMHLGIAFGVAYVITGSLVVGGAIAVIEPLCNSFGYALHERVWERIKEKKAYRSLA